MPKATTPRKPSKDFPLFPHRNGQWAKKIKGKLHYFGVLSEVDAALQRYLDSKDDLIAGRVPRRLPGEFTVRDLVNRFLTAKQSRVATGELSARSFADYHATCARLITTFGPNRPVVDLHSNDFEQLRHQISESWGPARVGNEIQRVRVLFNYAYHSGLVDHPVRFGPEFKRPGKRILRQLRQERGPRIFEAMELLKLLDKADQPLKAMILLGINCGFGNTDVGLLPTGAIDLTGGWVAFPRPKTGIQRRCPLWPETVESLRCCLEQRPTPKNGDDAALVFVTKYGGRWAKDSSDNPISKEMAKLLKSLKLHRPGLGFYALRHTFETIGGETRDQVAVDHVMGHARDDMASVYRERISDERLKAVTEFVRAWLWPGVVAAETSPQSAESMDRKNLQSQV